MKYNYMNKLLLLLLLLSTTFFASSAQQSLEKLELPSLLTTTSGASVSNTMDWEAQRRPEILDLFQSQVYGEVPEGQIALRFKIDHINDNALDGKAISKSVTLELEANGQSISINLFLFLPKEGEGPYPTFLGLNFFGNHTVHSTTDIPISSNWVRNNPEFCITGHQADSVSRGVRSSRWPVERMIARGYGLAVVYSGDIDPDFDDGFENGVHQLFKENRDGESWGTIAAWAWGLSRAMDYLDVDKDVASDKVIVMGHSRLGKAALWAGARDQRFAMVISNDSGCGGAALSRRKSGERVSDINRQFPHWFCDNFLQYNEKEEKLPVDQHMLLGLIAPRPLYVASAQQDDWADPYGEYLSLYSAQPAYELLGYPTSLPVTKPEVNKPVISGRLGYHIRTGRHDVTRYDWERFMDFADQKVK